MTSANQLFNITIARKAFKRTMPVWLIHAIVWAFALPVVVGNMLSYGYTDSLEIAHYSMQMALVLGATLGFGACTLMSELLTGYLYSTRSISLYHSIPIRRECLFITHTVVSLVALLLPAAACMTIAMAMCPAAAGYMVQAMGIYSLMVVFFTGFSMLCCHVTGHIAVGTVVYIILNFTAIVVEYVIKYICSFFYYGYEPVGFIFEKLSPIFHMVANTDIVNVTDSVDQMTIGYRYNGFGYLACIAIVGLVMMGLAWLLYKARRSESAGEVIAHAPLRPVFKYCMTAGFSLIIGLLFYAVSYMARYGSDIHSIVWFGICMAAGGAIGYWGSEMLLRKSLRVIRSGWKGFAAAVVCIALFCTVLNADLLGVETRVPDLEDVEHVRVNDNFAGYSLQADEGEAAMEYMIDLHKIIVENREELDGLRHAREIDWLAYEDYVFTSVYFNYTLKDGSQLLRRYYIPVTKDGKDLYGMTDLLYKTATDEDVLRHAYPGVFGEENYRLSDAMVYVMNPTDYDINYLLDQRIYNELIEAVRKDIIDGTLVSREGYYVVEKYGIMGPSVTIEAYEDDSRSLSLELSFVVDEGDIDGYYHDWCQFVVRPEAKNTYALLCDKGNYVRNGGDGERVYPYFLDME